MATLTIHVTEADLQSLTALAEADNITTDALIQRLIHQHLANPPAADQQVLRERALSVIGQFHSTSHDISIHHDDYLARAFDSPDLFGHPPILNAGKTGGAAPLRAN